MRLRTSILALTAVAGMALFGAATPAHAVFVSYTTVGTFTGGDAAGTNVFLDAANGVAITFNGIISNNVTVPPNSSASFGAFDTSATTSPTLIPVSSGFNLQIFQTSPTAGGPLTFVGALSGSLAINNSQAFIQFNAPLTQGIGTILYSILSADNNTPGRLNLVPSTTNAGVSTLQGQIGVAVPEPSAVVLMGLGTFGALLFRFRHAKARASA